ncbi:hypothetical protein GQ457_18G014080 [Hibiscus cannabinus]
MTDSGSNHVILVDAQSDTNGAEKEQPEPKSQTKVGDNRKLEYWSHYWGIKAPITEKVVKAQCKYCSKVLISNTENDTSNLKKFQTPLSSIVCLAQPVRSAQFHEPVITGEDYKTVIFAHIGQFIMDLGETLCSLKIFSRFKKIKSGPTCKLANLTEFYKYKQRVEKLKHDDRETEKSLAQWCSLDMEKARWKAYIVLKSQFLNFDSWGQESSATMGIVMIKKVREVDHKVEYVIIEEKNEVVAINEGESKSDMSNRLERHNYHAKSNYNGLLVEGYVKLVE